MNINSFYPQASSVGYTIEDDSEQQVSSYILWRKFLKIVNDMPFSDDTKGSIETVVNADFNAKRIKAFINFPCVATLSKVVHDSKRIVRGAISHTVDGKHFCSEIPIARKRRKPQRKAIVTGNIQREIDRIKDQLGKIK